MAQTACAGPDDMQGEDCRSWINSDRPIFASHDGKLYKLHFNSMRKDVLVDHGFTSLSFSLSADTRYIAYVGATGGTFSAYVYDNKDGTERPLPVADARLFQPEFSPDSRRLAWADVSMQAQRQDIMIMNLADGSIRTVHYPVDLHALSDYRSTEVRWAADGKQLLVGSVAYPNGAYYRISLPTLSITPIEGNYISHTKASNRADAGLHFSIDGHDAATYRAPCLQWQCRNQGRPTHGESVQIDKNYRMTVTTPEGVEQVVARGGCDACGGASVRALSWLEGGKYLVYEFKGAAYVYGVVEAKTSRLFDPGWQFGWYDNENRAPTPVP